MPNIGYGDQKRQTLLEVLEALPPGRSIHVANYYLDDFFSDRPAMEEAIVMCRCTYHDSLDGETTVFTKSSLQ